MFRKIFSVACAVVFVLALGMALTACGGGSGLSGTWVIEGHGVRPLATGGDRHYAKIEFSGNNFVTHDYSTVEGQFSLDRSEGPWRGSGDRETVTVEQDENRRIDRRIHRGTFSISDNVIELVFSDGTIQIFNFSHTENTLTLGGQLFIRR